jgi:CRP-like cAMP-binding protein
VTLHEVGAGEAIIDREREEPRLFIIVSGQARAFKDVDGVEVELGAFVEGEFFGEFALLTGRTNHATVRATTDVVALGVSEQDLHEVAAHDPEVWDTLWDYYHVRMLNNLMVSDTIFGKLSRETRDELIDLFELQELVQGDVLVDAAQPCPCVCLVLFGQLSITPSAPGGEVRAVREGEFFGFVASLSDEACGATVAATSDATLLCLPARAFRGVTRSNAGVAGEIRRLLRTRHQRPDLFLTGITRYAEHGVVD